VGELLQRELEPEQPRQRLVRQHAQHVLAAQFRQRHIELRAGGGHAIQRRRCARRFGTR